MPERLISALGVFVMMALAYAACPRNLRRRVNLRTVAWGVLLLVGFAVLVLRTPVNRAFYWANIGVDALLDQSRVGAKFVFGGLADDHKTFGFILAFQVLPTILFFAALLSVFYHLGVMACLISVIGSLYVRLR